MIVKTLAVGAALGHGTPSEGLAKCVVNPLFGPEVVKAVTWVAFGEITVGSVTAEDTVPDKVRLLSLVVED